MAILCANAPASGAIFLDQPWPHLVVDNFLSSDYLAQCMREIGSDLYEFDIEYRGTGRIEFSLLKSESLWRGVYCRRTIDLLVSAFQAEVKLNRDNFLQLRRMNEDTPEFPIHHDFIAKQETIASFLYLSGGWSPDYGGRLHLYHSQQDSRPSASIEPLQNRFIAFQTLPTHWHSVEKVRGWERLSVLSLWDVQKSIS